VRSADPPAVSRTIADAERAVYELTNRHRRARGLAPLGLDPRISDQARRHSAAMAAGTARFGHDGFAERVGGLGGRRSAENVAFNEGQRDPAANAVQGWLDSRAHCQNIEGPYDRTGVGVARTPAGAVFFTQIFVGD
jgi:uncharacterized protein YkwD